MTARGWMTEEDERLNNFATEPKVYVDGTQPFGLNQPAEKLDERLAISRFCFCDRV